ncbi:DUF2505 domain-containing protein [Pendulispora brunnea]|uniref:DUF2505 domain-containing protein n=1 Tax=Pendulispora brunnea TaxID=2905690 RepID=A0ABZ2K336_9BACT
MAQEFNVRNEFFCDEDTFWDAFFAEEFNRRLFLNELKFPEWKRLSFKDEGTGASRKVAHTFYARPALVGLPGPLQKIMGDRFAYEETGSYDGATHKYSFTNKPNTMADKIVCRGVLATEKLGEKHIVRTAKVNLEVKVMMVGKVAEDRFIADLHKSYSTAAAFTETYLKEKGLWSK